MDHIMHKWEYSEEHKELLKILDTTKMDAIEKTFLINYFQDQKGLKELIGYLKRNPNIADKQIVEKAQEFKNENN